MLRLALLLVIVLLPAAPASAAVVRGVEYMDRTRSGPVRVVTFEMDAGPGEANRIQIRFAGDRLRVTDVGAELRAEGLCELVSAHEAACPRTGAIAVDSGDRDDVVDVALGEPASSLRVDGGVGADRLTGVGWLRGGEGDDLITLTTSVTRADGSQYGAWGDGGLGNDTVIGSPGEDMLSGATGRDTLLAGGGDDHVIEGDIPGADDADTLDGGPGRDALDYAGHTEDLRADMRLDARQIAGTLDTVGGFEALRAGSGDDVIIGTAGDDGYHGGAGADSIYPGAGVDTVQGGAGPDVIDVHGHDLLSDYVHCGGGSDVVRADLGDRRRGCEREHLTVSARPVVSLRRRGGSLRARYDCAGVVADCYGITAVYWRDGGRWRPVGRVRIVCPDAASPCGPRARSEWIRLGRRARREFARRSRVHLQVISGFEERSQLRARRLAIQFFVLPKRGDRAVPAPVSIQNSGS